MSSIRQIKVAKEARDSMVKETIIGRLGEKDTLFLIELLKYCDATGKIYCRDLIEVVEKQYKTRVLKLP